MSELKWQDAVSYSYNFATAKPDILPMEKEHILGLSKVLERVGSDRDELYEALEFAAKTLERTANDTLDGRNAAMQARDALAKARGETP